MQRVRFAGIPLYFIITHLRFFAIDWLHDKEVSAPFALPALYQPRSHIPLERWLAARSTTNGIEQTHHQYNIDGVGLTLLSSIMHGYQYDARALSRQDLSLSALILPTSLSSNHLNRAQTALRRQGQFELVLLSGRELTISSHPAKTKRHATSHQNDQEDPTLRSPVKKKLAGKR